jgi:hypothetical protein
MAFLAETLVDEWLNRQGFFTVRGMKDGVAEIDLLGVRPAANGLEAWHVEVQTSFRPIGYIAPLSTEQVTGFAKSRTSAKLRPAEVMEQAVGGWVAKKFTSRRKHQTRDRAWPGLSWRFVFVHALVKDERELSFIAARGVEVVPFHRVLNELRHGLSDIRGNAGTDVSEIVEYFAQHNRD